MTEKIRRALLSVSDKSGLVSLAQILAEVGIELISTGGTAKALREAGLKVTEPGSFGAMGVRLLSFARVAGPTKPVPVKRWLGTRISCLYLF